MRVLHLTLSHDPLDDRIFYREGLSLVAAGHELTIIGTGDEAGEFRKDGIRCLTLPRGPLRTMLRSLNGLLEKESADIVHIHEMHTLGAGCRFRKRTGARLIYDVHEDFPEILRTFSRRPRWRRFLSSRLIALYEHVRARCCDAVIAVTPQLNHKFSYLKVPVVEVRNYPTDHPNSPIAGIRKEIRELSRDRFTLVYAGQISGKRRLDLAVETVRLLSEEHAVPSVFIAVGTGDRDDVEEFKALCDSSGTSYYYPPVLHEEVKSILESADMGWIVLPPYKNFVNALPNKSYEYLQAGLPFIASDLPLLREAVHDHGAGLIVADLNPAAIAAALADLLSRDPGLKNLKSTAEDIFSRYYRWESQESKLLELYESLENSRREAE